MKRLKGKSILVVDDEPMICEVFCELLTAEGAHVETATSGHSALQIISSKKFDILLSDVRMPNGDGIFLVKELRKKKQSDLSVYFCSGYNDVSEEDIKTLDIKAVFPKPFDFSKILGFDFRLDSNCSGS